MSDPEAIRTNAPLTSLPGFARLSDRAQKALVDSGADIDPENRPSTQRLTEILGFSGPSTLNIVLDLNRDFGGLRANVLSVRHQWMVT